MQKTIVLTCFLCFLSFLTMAQQAFPVKVNQQWGLMDEQGELIVQPRYQSIGNFKKFGYAIMQRNDGVGVINRFGREVIRPEYDDLKVLDSTLFAVKTAGDWMVINLDKKVILEKGYERVKIWDNQFLGYRQDNKWGVKTIEGDLVFAPQYPDLNYLPTGYFQSREKDKIGLLTLSGQVILPPEYDQIKPVESDLFFCKKDRNWGAADQSGNMIIPVSFQSYTKISDEFYQLFGNRKKFLFSIPEKRVVTSTYYDGFYPFTQNFVLAKKDRLLGLLDQFGNEILPVQYNEIQPFTTDYYRINRGGKWGIINSGLEMVLPANLDYIARPVDGFATVRNNGKFGAINLQGEMVIPLEFDKIEWKDRQGYAYKNEALTLFDFTDENSSENTRNFKKHFTITIGGQRASNIEMPEEVEADFQINDFEWFYSPPEDKWGLRRLDDGSIQIEPSFHTIRIERRYNMTIVGIENYNYYNFERTKYRFDVVYGVVNNEVGLLVTEVDMWDIRLSDFDSGSRVARCVFSNGRHGLISNNPVGRFLKKDYAYIGEFHDGVARMSVKGKLSGMLKSGHRRLGSLNEYLGGLEVNNYMIDYTLYDQDFESNADLVCDHCRFGYVDTTGQVVVDPQYDFAENFVNEVGIVQRNNKWGLVNAESAVLIPCKFDRLDFLENTDNQIIRISNNNEKLGMIDTSGQVVVDLKYDEIGAFKEGRLSVKRNGKWGFVNPGGVEVIPCIYSKVNDFSNRRAAVKFGRKWGFIDDNGNVIIDYKYRNVGNFRDGLAWVASIKGVGYINEKGKEAIPMQFDKAHDFENNVARVVVNGEWGLINKEGKYFLKPKYSDITPFDRNGTAVVRHGNANFRYSLINRTGNILTDKKYKKIGKFSENYASVKYKSQYGFINRFGKLVIKPQYSKVGIFQNSRAMIQRQGACGYLNIAGEEVIDLNYSKCLDFSENRAVVYKGARSGGIIDTLGNFLVRPNVNRLLEFSDGHGRVRDQNQRYYYISEAAERSDGYYQQAGEFRYGVAVVKQDGKWGIINQRGIEVVPPKYDKIEDFEDGYAIIKIKRFSGLTNLKGEIIIQPEYEYISYAGDGLFRIEQGDKVGYFSAEGEWIWALKE